jgi:hypothetical protein
MNSLSPWIAIGLTAAGMVAGVVFGLIVTWTQVQGNRAEIRKLWEAHKECNRCVTASLRRMDRFMAWSMGRSNMNKAQIDDVLNDRETQS